MAKESHIMQWDSILLALLFLSASAIVLWQMIQTCGKVVYPIDDPYIHMAMARHWAQDGIFGVSLQGFSASSSSPLWTALLAFCFLLFGVHEWFPLALNILISLILLGVITSFIRENFHNRVVAFIYSLLITLSLPLITQTFTGMEHPLHILFVILLCKSVITTKCGTKNSTVFLFAALSVLARYESLFVVIPLGLYLLINKQWKRFLYLSIGAALPVVALGCLYLAMGWYFFPNSIMVKSAITSQQANWFYGVLIRLYHQLYSTHHVAVLFMIAIPLLLGKLNNSHWQKDSSTTWLIVFICAALMHSAFASMGWFFRYEGYVLAFGFLSLAPFIGNFINQAESINRWQPQFFRWGIFAFILVLLISPFQSHMLSIQKIVPGAKNIYEQQYQMGRFLHQYYDEEAVLANDIGAINFLADIYCLDLMGLGSMEPLKAMKHGRFTPEYTETWCRLQGANIAILYSGWWKEAPPTSWRLVGTWTVPEKVTVSEQTVSFYALNAEAVQPLALNLFAFQDELPNDVVVKIFN